MSETTKINNPEQRPEITALSKDIDKFVSIREKLNSGQRLNEEEMQALDLNDETIQEFLLMQKTIAQEESKDAEDIHSEFIEKQNKEKERQERVLQEQLEEKNIAIGVDQLQTLFRKLSHLDSEIVLHNASKSGKDRSSEEVKAHNSSVYQIGEGDITLGKYINSDGTNTNYYSYSDVKKSILNSGKSNQEILNDIPILKKGLELKIAELQEEVDKIQKEKDRIARINQLNTDETSIAIKNKQADEGALAKIRRFLSGK